MNSRILVLCDDGWHPGEEVREGLAQIVSREFCFEFAADLVGRTKAALAEFQLIILAKANHRSAADRNPWLAAEEELAICEFVRRGGGLFAIHGGTCYRDFPKLRAVIGGAFAGHPEECPVTIEPQPHALAKGTRSFTERDEHYQMWLDDARAEVFLQSRSAAGTQPAGWIRTEAAGKVCVLTPGHTPAMWRQPEFLRLLLNGMNWLAGRN